MLAMLARAESGIRTYPTSAGDAQVFIESYPPPPTKFIVGAVHIAIPQVTFAKTLGFRVVVVDARGAFATPERFAHADELIMAWPDEALDGKITSNSFVVLLTHDPKLDDPALKIALPSPARYVGALGSPRTHEKRLARLREEGMPEEQLARLHAPIGLKLGASTPEEIAVSIIAEVVAARHGLTGKG
jgi:xanthine dehydrogenase accessory factor